MLSPSYKETNFKKSLTKNKPLNCTRDCVKNQSWSVLDRCEFGLGGNSRVPIDAYATGDRVEGRTYPGIRKEWDGSEIISCANFPHVDGWMDITQLGAKFFQGKVSLMIDKSRPSVLKYFFSKPSKVWRTAPLHINDAQFGKMFLKQSC